MDTSEQYIKMCDTPEIQDIWQDIDLRELPSFCYDKAIERVCIFLWAPDTLAEKVGNGEQNSIIVSIECERPLHHWTQEVFWKGGGTIWLPRQDQLQEMIPSVNYEGNLAHLAWMFDKFCNSSRANPFQPLAANYVILDSLTSMEQLWLAFAMKEKHGKTWDGDKWQ